MSVEKNKYFPYYSHVCFWFQTFCISGHFRIVFCFVLFCSAVEYLLTSSSLPPLPSLLTNLPTEFCRPLIWTNPLRMSHWESAQLDKNEIGSFDNQSKYASFARDTTCSGQMLLDLLFQANIRPEIRLEMKAIVVKCFTSKILPGTQPLPPRIYTITPPLAIPNHTKKKTNEKGITGCHKLWKFFFYLAFVECKSTANKNE